MATATRSWAPPGPYDLDRTLRVLARGPGDPAFRAAPDGSLWRASRTPAGPGTLCLTVRDGAVHGRAWGPGAAWLLETLPTLLGAEDDPAAFVPRHRLLAEAHRRNPGLRLARTGLVLESLIPSILEQKVTSDEAYRAWRLLLQRFGEPAPGPADGPAARMRVMPDPRTWALIPSWEWHKAGVDAKRSSTILRAVRVAARLEEAAAMDETRAAARLQAVPGIGPWTAAETLQRSNGAADAVTTGDLHLPKTVGYALTGERGTDDAGMLELLAPYAGQRHRACRLILLSGVTPPRRAPRFSVRDFSGI
ncbi:3-methyladenine DNA glycosylase/8-oxoguanine DNA glycosylase [Streptomyces olivoverticillatus]|uniref:3-methyladenine DNA glycosylase/8-oxoguanine DNA glycosylase n=1 Tax=Streptomyces olivoverticillatus TaxID=66427 RepID=A0A7W7LRC5_9ACTN|nr:DNA-3-methyladenine glycosylase 2 family protein [Streptomyces olivoverticillatus]MBB4894854.1 3-methyladenine DNA glycosylase/8-oxoguanine DNA glycosylase [Streptomyces olivoverticillatus]